MRRDILVTLIPFVIFEVLESAGFSRPGKPRLTHCRSPEKETFTCWWEPGSTGGLPTNYSLYYRKDNQDGVYECPDYHTAGRNSCFFDKNHTSIWVNYNITVVATNALGSNYSDPLDVDVVYIVQPHPPENLTLTLETEEIPYLLVRWNPPQKADTRSGWITLNYGLRVKREKEDKWEEYFAGQQRQFKIFSPHPGDVHMVQVRCEPDHGFWSKWSAPSYVEVPDYIHRERSTWILVAIFSAFVFIILIWSVAIKKNGVKHCLLPPVPGPKIKGFDTQHLKSGKSEVMVFVLINQGFPPISDNEDLLVEYLEVYESEDLELHSMNLQEDKIKENNSTDNDSGRGSCNSHSLLLENCVKEPETVNVNQSKDDYGPPESVSWTSTQPHKLDAPESANGTNCHPTILSSCHHVKPPYHSIPEITAQGHVSHNHIHCINMHENQENSIKSCDSKSSINCEKMEPDSKCDNGTIQRIDSNTDSVAQSHRAMEYVEVQDMNQVNMLILKPKAEEGLNFLHLERTGQDYSKVSGIVNDNVLLLRKEMAVSPSSDCTERGKLAEVVETSPSQKPGKLTLPLAGHLVPEGMQQGANGYVDTTTMLPTY